jgi:hypothetical protein
MTSRVVGSLAHYRHAAFKGTRATTKTFAADVASNVSTMMSDAIVYPERA